MDKQNLKNMLHTADKTPILFFGTPDFAAYILNDIVESGYNVVGVVTMPDKPAGRGHKLQASAVKKIALKHKLKLFQPENLKDETFLADIAQLKAEIFVVIAFRILPEVLWSMPAKGTFNLHASLLPAYRGAAPINRAIENGETVTGNTTFLLDKNVDTGNILLQQKVNILPEDNAGTLHNKLMKRGAELVALTIEGLANETLKGGTAQNEKLAANAPIANKIFKADTKLSFKNMTAEQIVRRVRAMSPYPGAWVRISSINGCNETHKIFSAMVLPDYKQNANAGESETDNKSFLRVCAADKRWVELLEIQAPNKRRMSIRDYLNGTKLDENTQFE